MMALTDNLVSYWKMDESSGNAADSVSGYTATNSNATYTTGKLNNCAVFNGSSAVMTVADNALDTIGNNISVFYWAKTTKKENGYTVSKVDTSNSVGFYTSVGDLSTTNGATFSVRLYPDTLQVGIADVTDGNWHFVGFTYNGTTLKTYVDGDEERSVAKTATINCTTDLYFSTRNGSSGFWTGSEDAIGLWSRALSPTEVTSLYNSGNGLQYPFSTSAIKTVNDLAKASVKTVNDLAIASVKTVNDLA